MTITANHSWINLNGLTGYPSRNIYLCVDDPWATRPEGITDFIGIQCEPNAIYGLRDAFIEHHAKFDVLITYDEEILSKCSNAKFCEYGTTFINEDTYNNVIVQYKLPRISSITGWKTITDGHRFRQQLYMNQTNIPLPIDWFRSEAGNPLPIIKTNPILGPNKEQLFFNYQYSLVIENSRQTNYFSEKLIDCLLMKTIPIYWGCPNINKWFDTTGWIILETDTIEELVNNAKLDYNKYIDIVEKNYEIAKQYATPYLERIYQIVIL